MDRLINHNSTSEEEYFFKKDQELIKELKKNNEKVAEENEKKSHLRHCGNCGASMEETVVDGVNFLACHSCDSVELSLEALKNLKEKKVLKDVISLLEEKKLSRETAED